jgi:P-type Cu2+ transporter
MAVLDLCERAGIDHGGLTVEAVEVEPGLGIAGRVAGRAVAIGRAEWLARQGVALPSDSESTAEPDSRILCAIDGRLTLRLGWKTGCVQAPNPWSHVCAIRGFASRC